MARRRGGGARKGRSKSPRSGRRAKAHAQRERARVAAPVKRSERARPEARLVSGSVEHHGRFAFVVPEGGGGDFYVSGASLKLAMDGDRVSVRPFPDSGGGRREATIVEILSRGRKTFVGRLRQRGKRWTLDPDEGDSVEVLGFARGLRREAGVMAVVRITRYPDADRGAAGTVEEILGDASSPRVRANAALRSRELPDGFPKAVLRETEPLPDRVGKGMWRGRRELFDLPLFTIDGADAKDFDDAVSLEELGGGRQRLGVHIADVSSYVKPGSTVDEEAYKRATSVYLPGRTIPMLPPKLSDHLCSLMPRVERLALSCFMDLDSTGRVKKARFEETVIRSWHRFTYRQAELILLGKRVKTVPKKAVDAVLRMGKLAKKLTAARLKRGALDLDMPEYKIEVDAAGDPVSVERVERLSSHRLIEEFMILANEAAARHLIAARAPAPHRIHPDPEPKKLEELAGELSRLGVKVARGLAGGSAEAVQRVLKAAKDHPLGDTIGILTVRSLKQAVYSAEPSSHFGLASAAYTHFTSPIRRYPDLLVHRAIKGTLGKSKSRCPRLGKGELAKAARYCSDRERLAADAEREAVEALRIAYLAQGLPRALPGRVTRQLPYGALVTLDETGAVGLARGLRAPMGAIVSVRIHRVDVAKRQLDLKPA
jgi:ribonuclease R